MTDEKVPFVKTIVAAGIGAQAVPPRVPSSPIWVHWLNDIGIYDWQSASGFMGTIATFLGLVILVWRGVIRPYARNRGWMKPAKKYVVASESDFAELNDK